MSTKSFHRFQSYLPLPCYHSTSLRQKLKHFWARTEPRVLFFEIFLFSELVCAWKNLKKNAKIFRVIGIVDNDVLIKFNTVYLKWSQWVLKRTKAAILQGGVTYFITAVAHDRLPTFLWWREPQTKKVETINIILLSNVLKQCQLKVSPYDYQHSNEYDKVW